MRRYGDLFHGSRRLLHHRSAAFGCLGRGAARRRRVLRIVADLADRRRHLLRRRRNLVDLARFRARIPRALNGTGADFRRRRRKCLCVLAHRLQNRAHRVDTRIDRDPQAPDLIGPAYLGMDRQIFGRHSLQQRGFIHDSRRNLAGKNLAGQCAEQHDEQRSPEVDPGGAGTGVRGVLCFLGTPFCAIIRGLVCGCDRLIDFGHCAFGLQNTERIAGLVRGNRSVGSIAILLIRGKRRRQVLKDFMVMLVPDQRLVGCCGIFVSAKRLLAFGAVFGHASRRGAQDHVQVLAPVLEHSAPRVG